MYKICFHIMWLYCIFIFYSKYPDNVHMLHSIATILSHAKSTNQEEVLSTDNLRRVYPLIKVNLSNPAHLVRQKTLEILKEFEQIEYIATEEVCCRVE